MTPEEGVIAYVVGWLYGADHPAAAQHLEAYAEGIAIDCTEGLVEDERVIALKSALRRTEQNFRSAVLGQPVRDMAENLAENRAALDGPPRASSELEQLRRWKREALPLLDGLQEIGQELDLPLGTQVTGPKALAAIKALKKRAQ